MVLAGGSLMCNMEDENHLILEAYNTLGSFWGGSLTSDKLTAGATPFCSHFPLVPNDIA